MENKLETLAVLENVKVLINEGEANVPARLLDKVLYVCDTLEIGWTLGGYDWNKGCQTIYMN